MKHYQSKKKVHAAKITAIITTSEDDLVEIQYESGASKLTLEELEHKPIPAVGMYIIQYEDGYTSFCPGETFEKDYFLLSDYQVGDVEKDSKSTKE